MEGKKISNENKSKKPISFMDSSSLPLSPSSFPVGKKPYFMNYGDSGASSSGTKPYCPPSPSDQSPRVDDDNNKTTSNQNHPPPSDLKMKNPIGDTSGVDASRTRKAEHGMDPKKLRRIMSNKASARKSRMKKLQYVTDMEEKAKSLETLIAGLTPQVSLYKNHHEFLQMEHQSLNQRMTTYNDNSIIINAEIEENKAQVARLRQLHLSLQQQIMQQQKRMQPVWEPGFEELLNSSMYPNPGPGKMVYANPNQGNLYNGESIHELLRQNQHKMKQVPVQYVEDHHNAAGTNMLMMMTPGWVSGTGQKPNPSFNFQSRLPQNAKMINQNLSGVEQMLSLNNNHISLKDPRNGFM